MPPDNRPTSPEDEFGLPPINFDSAMSFTSKPIGDAFDYWNGLRDGRLMPDLPEVKLTDMRPFLPFIGLVEIRTRPDRSSGYFVTLAGAAVESIFGSRAGRWLDEDVPDAIASRWRLGFDMVRRSAKPVKATAHVAFEGKTNIGAEILVAPLGDGDMPCAFLVAIASVDTI